MNAKICFVELVDGVLHLFDQLFRVTAGCEVADAADCPRPADHVAIDTADSGSTQ